MHPIEEKIVKSFHFVKQDIEQLQKAYLAFDNTQIKVLDTIKEQDALLKKQANLIDDLKVRVADREKASTKRKVTVDAKIKKDASDIASVKKALAESQKMAKQAMKDVERLAKKVEKLSAKPKTTKKATSKKVAKKATTKKVAKK